MTVPADTASRMTATHTKRLRYHPAKLFRVFMIDSHLVAGLVRWQISSDAPTRGGVGVSVPSLVLSGPANAARILVRRGSECAADPSAPWIWCAADPMRQRPGCAAVRVQRGGGVGSARCRHCGAPVLAVPSAVAPALRRYESFQHAAPHPGNIDDPQRPAHSAAAPGTRTVDAARCAGGVTVAAAAGTCRVGVARFFRSPDPTRLHRRCAGG
ncbi:hypothetical protein GCM10027615_34680 [Plantactinospora veratri]